MEPGHIQRRVSRRFRNAPVHLAIGLPLVVGLACGCATGPRRPPTTSHVPADFDVVPYPPPPARPQELPPAPDSDSVWVNGEWSWDGARWTWWRGAWVLPPLGAKLALWATARLPSGSLVHAPGIWVLPDGRRIASVWILEHKNPKRWAAEAATPCLRRPPPAHVESEAGAVDGATASVRCLP